MPAKLSDVAKLVGVSPSTVSRALSGSGAGNLKLLEEIRTAAEQAGYPLDRYNASLARSRIRLADSIVFAAFASAPNASVRVSLCIGRSNVPSNSGR